MLKTKIRRCFCAEQSQGFTLIEVLVATVILISSIAVLTMVYRGAYISSETANKQVLLVGKLPPILAQIKRDIRKLGNTSQVTINQKGNAWDVQYQWEAVQLEFKGAPDKLDPDSGEYLTPEKKYKLWQVTLLLKAGSLTKEYSFKELSWNNVY
ncbi:type II secretion system protein J [Colwelliaceae bacterium 6441]